MVWHVLSFHHYGILSSKICPRSLTLAPSLHVRFHLKEALHLLSHSGLERWKDSACMKSPLALYLALSSPFFFLCSASI